ncbi:glycosyltransferase [Paenibacillus medicaginis]|uniref:Glycosyltransferase n=1 Tax=Paenibacillus medicaginis TaxID=1470560 RepID=A0ABV5BX49_9BACL
MQKTSIVISASPDDLEYLAASIDNIRKFTERGTYELIVVEHGGSWKVREWLADQTDVLTLFHEGLLTQGQAWNKGVEVASGDNILFLHSDTLVTEYWLDYMMQSLYQDQDIAGVGPVTNNAEGDQAVEVSYTSMEGMLQQGRICNRNFGLKQKLAISDFCMFFKKAVVSEIGPFHEELGGEELAADYCLRIAQAKYRLMVCTNVFVHHYGLKMASNRTSKRLFKTLWGFGQLEVKPQSSLNNLLPIDIPEVFRILVVGSGCGATLLSLKQQFPEAEVYGIEANTKARLISQNLLGHKDSVINSFERAEFKEEFFDYILLSTTQNLVEALIQSRTLLKSDGKLIADLPNVYHYSTVVSLVKGKELDERNLAAWSIEEFTAVLEKINFEVASIQTVKENLQQEEQVFINGLRRLVPNELPEHFDVSRFLIIAKKETSPAVLHESFNRLFQNPSEELAEEILKSSASQILKAVKSYNGPVVPLLNYLAISHFERNQMAQVFPLLSKAHELNPDDPTTLLNLGTVYYGAGDDEKALYWLERIPEKSEQIESWMYQIQETINLKSDTLKWLKFLLLRTEHGVKRDESMAELFQLIQKEEISFQTISNVIRAEIGDKLSTVNLFVNYLYENGHFTCVLAMLEIALEYQDDQDETLFILANLSYKLNDCNSSLKYLNRIKMESEKVSNLRMNITTLQLD